MKTKKPKKPTRAELEDQLYRTESEARQWRREAQHQECLRLELETKVHGLWKCLTQPVEEMTKAMKGFGFGDYRSLLTRLHDRLESYGIPLDQEVVDEPRTTS